MVNWGLIGCGDISNKRVAPAIKSQPQSRLLAVMSPYKNELDSFGEKHNVQKRYLDLDEMLEDKEIDAVYVATPIFLHYGPALKALKRGKHVLVEKPMALKNSECEELIKEAEKQNVKLGVAYFRRFFPKLEEVKRIINEGIIGDIIQIRILYHTWYNPDKNDPKAWRVEKAKAGGGPLWDMGSHKFDMMIDLVGMPKFVCSIMTTQTHSYEVEDSCSVIMEMENRAHCLASFNWNSKLWSDEFEILGTLGRVKLAPCDSENIEVQLNPRIIKGLGKEITNTMIQNHQNVHYPLINDFVNAIVEGREPIVSGKEGYKTNRILAAVEESAITGRKVEI
ncbi:MAG: Gfo/Idh/MocA family oxidoreductase [Firmicutes bacterium]|nr:Gfo/Idh/MocA family oxidoreductase [Bacillota bacterium]